LADHKSYSHFNPLLPLGLAEKEKKSQRRRHTRRGNLISLKQNDYPVVGSLEGKNSRVAVSVVAQHSMALIS
jgi:hypothetical protein